MKKVRMVLLAGLLIAALCATAQAWEFHMTGNFQWTYEYYAQAGRNGFFGTQNVANPALAVNNWFSPNFWVGSRLMSGTQYGLVTGLDASMQYQRMVLNPEIRVNPAIRIRGQYWIGGYSDYHTPPVGQPIMTLRGQYASSFYLNQQTGSTLTAPLAIGQWNTLWMTAQTPWGILVAGKRGAPFGMGLLNDEGEHSVVSESLAIVAPYGPLRIGIFAYPWRQGVFLDNHRNLSAAGVPQVGQGVSNTSGTAYAKLWDASNIRLQPPQMGAFVTYSNGPLDAGLVYLIWQNHVGPESAATLAGQLILPTIDGSLEGGNAYVKYNNGRFFFNAELAWDRWDVRFQQPLVPQVTNQAVAGLGSPYQPVFNEDWNVGTEFGFLCGPSKLSMLYAWISGPDRRQGIWISKSSWNYIALGAVPCNYALFLPYSQLLGYTYASGLNFRNGLGEGGITDATVVASRLDYAVAANLNWYGSFLWAWRNSGGWPWGVLTVTGANTAANAVNVFGYQAGVGPTVTGAPQNLSQNTVAPNIPDNNLGWEMTTGVDWKLLEGLTTNLRLAYWQPGEWFKYACVDRNLVTTDVAGTLIPTNANGAVIGSAWGVNPAKSIDPIWAFTGQLNVDF